MRVPGISSTAGYAAKTHYEPYLSEQFYTGLPSTSELNKNNGNILLSTQQLSLENSRTFVSSADEFVKRALSSVPTSYQAESNLEFLRTRNENKNFNKDVKEATGEHISTHEETNKYNTYRSFKDAFNINKTFYEECAKNLNALNTQDIEDDIDPILVINTPYPDDICQNSSPSAIENMKINAENEQSLNGKLDYITSDIDKNAIDHFNDNDYDDQTMLDLCHNQDDEIVNETINRDAYLTSPTSSSISDHTPKRTFSYFPRGIINPNYPGFQHFAHTLSEHFITGTSQSDSYDSDMSEYEMELSADSIEDFSDEANEQFNSKLNKYNNNLEGHHSAATRKMHPDELSEPELNVAQNNVYESYLTCPDRSDDNCNIDIGDLPISLKTTLTLLEPADRMPSPCETPEPNEVSDTNEYLKGGEFRYVITTPPDILMKDDHLPPTEHFLKKENRPDLLHGVSPHHIVNKFKAQCTIQNSTSINDHTNGVLELPPKDEMSLGVTPVDIIGDFGQEVEREFGLLVSGYRRLVDVPIRNNENDAKYNRESISKHAEHLVDAVLSNVNDEIDGNKYLAALKHCNDDDLKELEHVSAIETPATTNKDSTCDFIEDNNAVDWSLSTNVEENTVETPHIETHEPDQSLSETSIKCTNDETNIEEESKSMDDSIKKPKYQKASYDERQLPPVAIEYKRCQQNQRKGRSSQHSEKNTKSVKKPSFANRFLHGKRSVFKSTDTQSNTNNRKSEETEIRQYKQLIHDKELILSNSRYTKLSSWAQYLKNSVKDRNSPNSTELISPSALDLFEAYKVGGEVDKETLQKHLKMAKEIEKKRRSDREEIRRRLAMGDEDNANNITEQKIPKSSIQSALQNGLYICRMNDVSSDTESHSSDSETCPKLSKIRQGNLGPISSSTNDHTIIHPYHGRPLSVNCTKKEIQQQKDKEKQLTQQQKKQQKELLPITDEDRECDFFTKQARLQIEARMALAQAKEMAHMHMEFERQNRRMSPITGIIRSSLDKIGMQMAIDKRRVSRQMLTDMNIAQLQILVNSLHTHIEDLNESLVQFLVERDDLHVGQDAMLADIEELTRFIAAQEHLTHQHKKATKCNRSK